MWIGRRWRALKTRLLGLPLPLRVLVVATMFLSPCLCCYGAGQCVQLYRWTVYYTPEDRAFLRNRSHGYHGGLPSVARKLIAEMDTLHDPETAVRLHPEWKSVTFRNGDWVFGRGIGAFELKIGHGTTVLKDSRGRVRVFFGVYPAANTPLYVAEGAESLDAFDTRLLSEMADVYELREWPAN